MSISPLTTRRKFSFTKCSCIIPMIKLPQMDRQQAINIPNSFTKQYLSSCMSDTLGPVKITTRYGQDTNMQYYIAWTNLDRASISSMFASESGYNCTISSGIPLSTILSFIVWRAHQGCFWRMNLQKKKNTDMRFVWTKTEIKSSYSFVNKQTILVKICFITVAA